MDDLVKLLILAASTPYWLPLLRSFMREALAAGEEPQPPPARPPHRRSRRQNPFWETGRRPDLAAADAFGVPLMPNLPHQPGGKGARTPGAISAGRGRGRALDRSLRGSRWSAGFGRRGA